MLKAEVNAKTNTRRTRSSALRVVLGPGRGIDASLENRFYASDGTLGTDHEAKVSSSCCGAFGYLLFRILCLRFDGDSSDCIMVNRERPLLNECSCLA